MATVPNILFIMADTLGAQHVGCYGNPHVKTPHIDRLARSGTVFEKAFTQSPVCMPSRATIATGRYPHSQGESYPAEQPRMQVLGTSADPVGAKYANHR